METDTRQARAETQTLTFARTAPAPQSLLDGPMLWITGGATLLLWTALALLLTSA